MIYIFDKRYIKFIDFYLLYDVLILSMIGILTISSATHAYMPGHLSSVIMQSVWLLLSIIVIFFVMKLDYKIFEQYYLYIYITSIILLLVTLLIGHSANGAQRWITLGPVSFQFSEFTKIALIITLAKLLSNDKNNINKFLEFLKIISYALLPFLLIVKQNDTGTALVLLVIMINMIFMSGINIWYLVGIFCLGVISAPLAYKYLMHGYQKQRIMTFLNPNLDINGAGYHVYQSKIAIGSGQIFGFGLYHGPQIQNNFIPEANTDFIFSVVGQEFGLIGALLVIALYFILLYKLYKIALNAKDSFGRLVVFGILSMFLIHIFENIGMTIGLTPMAGIPLPFMSYGGSSLMTNMIAVAISLNIGMRRQKINF